MNGIDYLLTALAALRGNPMRSLLVTLMIILDVTSVIAMLANGLIVADRDAAAEVA